MGRDPLLYVSKLRDTLQTTTTSCAHLSALSERFPECTRNQFALYMLHWSMISSAYVASKIRRESAPPFTFSSCIKSTLNALGLMDRPFVHTMFRTLAPLADYTFDKWWMSDTFDITPLVELLNIISIELRGAMLSCVYLLDDPHNEETGCPYDDCLRQPGIMKFSVVPELLETCELMEKVATPLLELTTKNVLLIFDCTNLDRRRDEFDPDKFVSFVEKSCARFNCDQIVLYTTTIDTADQLPFFTVRSVKRLKYVQTYWTRYRCLPSSGGDMP